MTTLPELLTLKVVAWMLRWSKAHVCRIVNGQMAGTPPISALALGRRKLVRDEAAGKSDSGPDIKTFEGDE